MQHCDIAVVGGGAAGLAAAIEAKRTAPTMRVAVLEKGEKVGQKILATGNGRCNLSNSAISEADYNGGAAPLLRLAAPWADDAAFFASMGLLLRRDEAGRLYPYSNAAASVLDALRFTAAALGVELCTGFPVRAVRRQKGGFCVESTDGRILNAARVILAAGTPAGQKTAESVLTWPILAEHTMRPFVPALAPVPTDAALTGPVKGLRVKGRATLLTGEKPLRSREGEISFGGGYLSGICIMDLSGQAATTRNAVLSLDLAPALSARELGRFLADIRVQRATFPVEDAFTGLFHRRIAGQLLRAAGVESRNRVAGALTGRELSAFALLAKDWRFPVTGQAAWNTAQVARGGLSADNCGPGLQSRRVPGLYFCGEILDVNGDCGGFNLHWAWMSGRCAGAAAAYSL